MNRDNLLTLTKIAVIISINICIFHYYAEYACSYQSKDEFASHYIEKDSCISIKCHAKLAEKKKSFQHAPFSESNCTACHMPEISSGNNRENLNQRMICESCHESMANELKASKFVHGPINEDICTSCHNPHESDIPFLLKKQYNMLCSTCHKIEKLFSGSNVHKPVQDGNCGLCHDPHASNFKSRLTDVGANLCITCHDEMVAGMTSEFVHEPLIKTGCTVCHDPHAGEGNLRLKSDVETLCFNCHKEKRHEIEQYNRQHEPAKEGKCISCHSPHFSENKSLLRGKVDALCFECHKDSSIWKKRLFQHGPVVQGNCVACHGPHGSDNAYILRLSFPHKFYSPYEKGKYDLCFLCHIELMVTSEKTEMVTQFRNGETNLHMLHVNQKKGRTCRACHDVHASDQEDHIREEFPFGAVNIPINYFKTETGGRCVSGCHVERRYDRLIKVMNR